MCFLIKNYFSIFIAFQITGSILLIIIGIHTIITAKKNNIETIDNEKIFSMYAFIQGFLIAFLNPKILAFFAVLFSQFIYSNATLTDQTILVLTPGIIDTIWYIFVSVAITTYSIKNYINSNKIFIQKVMGFLLILIALTLLYKFI